MKNVPIKFRGISIITGKYVYGWAFKQDCPMSSFPAIIDDDDKYNEVYPDSVAQLVGYDIDGNEVYEGDLLTLGSYDFIAGIKTVSYTAEKMYVQPEKDFSDFHLKEKTDE